MPRIDPLGGMALAEKTLKPRTVEPKMSAHGKITLGVGVGVLVAGYMFLATGSMTLAPLLIIGGLVTVGIGIYNL
ncbi:MAG TPA: hypothetical protein VHE12_01315 [bacterium]|nr:hypothetical protein [bacterium]